MKKTSTSFHATSEASQHFTHGFQVQVWRARGAHQSTCHTDPLRIQLRVHSHTQAEEIHPDLFLHIEAKTIVVFWVSSDSTSIVKRQSSLILWFFHESGRNGTEEGLAESRINCESLTKKGFRPLGPLGFIGTWKFT